VTDVRIPEPGGMLKCNPGVKCGPHLCGESIGGDTWSVYSLDLDGGSSLLVLGIGILVANTGALELDGGLATLKLDQRIILIVTAATGVLELDGDATIVNPMLMPSVCTDVDLAEAHCVETFLYTVTPIELVLEPEECRAA